MRSIGFVLQMALVLLSVVLCTAVLLPELRSVLPPLFVSLIGGLPLGDDILRWPVEKVPPLLFVGLLLSLDAMIIRHAIGTQPTLSDVLRRPRSKAKAKQLMKLREYRHAATTYIELGQVDQAARLLAETGDLLEAGRLYLSRGQSRRAADVLRKVDGYDAEKAGDLVAEESAATAELLYRRAGAYHAEHGDTGKAGRCYYKAGDHDTAKPYLMDGWDRLFRADGQTEVADMLLGVGALHDAGLAYSRSAAVVTDRDEGHRLNRKAAALLAKAGDPRTGAEILETSGQPEEAAELFAHAGDIDKAVRLLCAIKNGKRAAEILIKVGQTERAVDVLAEFGETASAAELAVQSGMVRKGALLLERSGDAESAVRLLEEAGEYIEAGDILQEAGAKPRAAVMYERGEAYDRAASLYEGFGEEMRAAALYAKAGDALRAGQLFMKHGRIREASQVLRGVTSVESRDLHAKLGAQFLQLGESGQALEHLMSAIAQNPLTKANCSTYYQLAMLYEQLGDINTALSIYQRLYVLKPEIVGLKARLEQVRVQAVELANSRTHTPTTEPDSFDEKTEETPVAAASANTGEYAAVDTETGLASTAGDASSRYRLGDELGRGAMGQVFKAYDQLLQRGIALKLLPEVLASDQAAHSAFLAEARAAAALHHPNIATLFDVGVLKGTPYIAMELVDGGNLSLHLESHPDLPLTERLRLLTEVAVALDAAHRRGIIHRDVKPGNILVDSSKHVRLVDFGIARARGSLDSGKPVGTPNYMAPEQARGLAVDLRADLYSLGVVLFEICSGQLPFKDGNVIEQHISVPAPPLRLVKPDLPEQLEVLVASCLEKDPAQRPESAVQVRVELESIMAGLFQTDILHD